MLRKLMTLMVLMCMTMLLIGCSLFQQKPFTTLPQTLKEAVVAYKEKLTSLIDDESEDHNQSKQLIRFYNDTPYNPDDMIHKDTYLEVYNKQKDNSNHVGLTEYLIEYKNLLDDIHILLESFDINEVEADLEIDFQGMQALDANVYLSKDSGVVVKFLVGSLFSSEPVFYGIKVGYEKDVFFVKEFTHFKERNIYNYFEFLENISLINMRYRDEQNYEYEYRNQIDNELFLVYYASDLNLPDDYTLRWYNPKTNIRTTYHDGNDAIRHFEVFNQKTAIFDYTDYLNGNISLRFQLLEASGWDYAYLDSNAHPNEGVYKDGVMLFQPHQYKQFNVDLSEKFANVGVTIDLKKEELTNEILNLNVYQMDFNNPTITIEYIQQTLDNLYEESKHLAVYRGIDFYSGNIKETLYNEIDDDLKEIED